MDKESPDINLNSAAAIPDRDPILTQPSQLYIGDTPLDLEQSEFLFEQNFQSGGYDPSEYVDGSEYNDGEGMGYLGISRPVVVNCEVKPLDSLVEFSEANGYWHVKSGKTGMFGISFTFENVPPIRIDAQFRLRFELRRTNSCYEHLSVNKVCSKHVMEGEFPIVPATPSTRYFNIKEKGEARRSFLYYCVGRPEEGSSQMAAEVKLRFPCRDSCVNTDFEDHMETNKSGKVVMKEKARFLELRVTLEAWDAGEDAAQQIALEKEICVPVWIKATIAPRELEMKQRHTVKGGAAVKRNLAVASASKTCEAKRQKTDQGPGPCLRDLVATFTADQNKVWSSLLETLDHDQRELLGRIDETGH